jgi:hypothetical protein
LIGGNTGKSLTPHHLPDLRIRVKPLAKNIAGLYELSREVPVRGVVRVSTAGCRFREETPHSFAVVEQASFFTGRAGATTM